ncbi:MAG: IS1182 family transposase [Candidatus Cloacimonetes bacterium]|nr:IS1182 family transposase [Candidatus Cloacimonadota bacterium]
MHITGNPREQVVIATLDEMVQLDNPVRQLDSLIDEIIESGNIDIPTGKSRVGRRAYSAVSLVKLYLYGYLNKIVTCRHLESAAKINLEVRWLIKGQTPSYKTIADFKKNHGSFIHQVEERFREILREEAYISNQTWVIDGTKVKANAARDMKSLKKLKEQVAELNQTIENYLGDDKADWATSKESDDGQNNGSTRADSDMTPSELEKAIEKRDKAQRLIDIAEEKGIAYIAPTDQDALLVKSRRGKVAGYNVQMVVDAKNHMIAGHKFVDSAGDSSSLYHVIKAVSDSTGTKPAVILADRGYTNYLDIQKLSEELDADLFVSLQKSSDEIKGLVFKYDSSNDQMICPMGKIMRFRGKQYTRGQYYYSYHCNKCNSCELMGICTKSKSGRTRRMSENQVFKECYKNLMETELAKEQKKRRKTIVEHVFGTIANMMGYNGFKARGKRRVEDELSLYAFAYNFKRLWNLTNQAKLSRGVRKRRMLCLNHIISYLLLSIWTHIRLYCADMRLILRDIMRELAQGPKLKALHLYGGF